MIKLLNALGKKYAVLGFGKSGEAAANSLRASRANFIVWDDNEQAREKILVSGFTLCNPMTIDLAGYEAVILSPSIPVTHPTPHPIIDKCQKMGIPVIGELDLLFRTCPKATYVGITGTNGKSTTTALVAHILKEAGRKVQMGGNIGTPALALDPLDEDGIYVLEMSSFQLDLMHDNKFKVAVFLNVTPDHFDRHGDMKGYVTAKKRIMSRKEHQVFVIGTDEPETVAVANDARRFPHLQIEEISVCHKVEHGVIATDKQLFVYDKKGGVPIVDLASLKRLPGAHNAQNAAAAFATCRALHLSNAQIVAGLKSFPGLAHRQQLVAESEGVRFVNDSKATNADAAGKALACYNNIYWIAGGKPKAGGLNGLEGLMPQVAHTFLIGTAAEDFGKWLDGKAPYSISETLDKAVKEATAMAQRDKKPGAVVLLSPACASFDQFTCFEERGDKFIAAVNDVLTPNPYPA